MKPKKICELRNCLIEVVEANGKRDMTLTLKYNEMIEIIIALDKIYPKNITEYMLHDEYDLDDYYVLYLCPTCGMVLDRDYQHHCTNCGQVMNWKYCGEGRSLKQCNRVEGWMMTDNSVRMKALYKSVSCGKFGLLRELIGIK